MKGARAIADIDSGTILATVEIGAAPDRVFRALSTPEELVRWWGSDTDYRTTSWTQDFRPGGEWRSEGIGREGSHFSVGGNFIEIDSPRKLAFTWLPSWANAVETRVVYTLEPIEGGTRLVLRHDGFVGRADSCRDHASGWEKVLGWLARHAESDKPARWYMLRLIPPRPDFAMTLTDDERAIMRAHAVHLRARVAKGDALIAGPVADPQGPWGLGIVRSSDPAELQEFLANDPAVKSNRGFRYEVLPLLSAITN